MRILIVEDEKRIAENVKKILESQDFLVDVSKNGEDAEIYLETNNYDLVILDLMLPDANGINICSKLRANGFTSPILLLTAKSQLDDKIEGFDAGADDYLTKPFLSEELSVRVKALLRRKTGVTMSPNIELGKIVVNTNSREVTVNGTKVSLSPKEYSLLEFLSHHPGKAIDRMEILENVWGDGADQFSNTVDVHIRYLRKKLGDPGGKIIQTVKGKGYLVCKD